MEKTSGPAASPGQSFEERAPVEGLAHVVVASWVQTVAQDAGGYQHRDTPHGGFELRFSAAAGLHIIGPRTVPTVTEVAAGTTEVGLRFKPGTAVTVLGVSGVELVDTEVPADEILGPAVRRLVERLSTTPDPGQRARLLQHHVLGRLAAAKEADPVIGRFVSRSRANTSMQVDQLAAEVGLSSRQLRRRCLEVVGLSPKALQRTMRFQFFEALAQRNLAEHGEPAGAGLAEMAAAAGYADQAHLTRECMRLTRLSPRARLHELAHKCAEHDHAAVFVPLLR